MRKIIFALILAVLTLCSVSPAFALTPTQQQWSDQKAKDILATATSLVGVAQYDNTVYDPVNLRFGCGGFVYYCFKTNGIDLLNRNNNYMWYMGEPVAKEDLQPGDLVFFDSYAGGGPTSHVAIYYGDNKVIHAADSKSDVIISSLSGSYYTKYYVGARRLIPGYAPIENPALGDKITDYADSLRGSYFGSGRFIDAVYKQFGIDLGTVYPSKQAQLGEYVPKEELQRGDVVFFSTEQSPNSVILAGIYAGNQEVILSTVNGREAKVIKTLLVFDFYKAHYMTARRFIKLMPETTPGNPPENTPENPPGNVPIENPALGDKITDYADSLKGSYFGSGRFIDAVYKQFGIDLGTVYPSKQAQLGKFVPKEELQRGDVVFFSTEQYPKSVILAGIYAGNQQIILSTVNGREAKVIKTSLTYDFYNKHYMTARRFI